MPGTRLRSLVLLFALAIALLAGLACSGPPGAAQLPALPPGQSPAVFPQPAVTPAVPQPGGVLRVAVPAQPQALNSRRSDCDDVCRLVTAGVLETLFLPGGQGYLTGVLSTNWEQPDLQTVRIRLRPGVRFTDGTPLDAEAARVSLEAIGLAEGFSPYRDLWNRVVTGVEVASQEEVAVRTSQPFAPLLSLLASPWAPITAPENALGFLPRGTGPYLVSLADTVDTVLVPNPDWWQRPGPWLEEIRFVERPVAGAEAGVPSGFGVAMRQGGGPGLSAPGVIPFPAWSSGALVFATMRGPFQDVRARRGVAAGLDREGIVRAAGLVAVPASGPVAPGQWQAPGMPEQRFDLALARQLLAQAGAEASPVRLLIPAGHPAANPLEAALRGLGLRVETRVVTPVGWARVLETEPWDLALAVDGLASFDAWFTWDAAYGRDVWGNWGRWQDPRFATLVQEAAGLRLREEQEPKYRQAAQLLVEEAPRAWLWAPAAAGYLQVTPAVQGVQLLTGQPDWARVWLRR